MRRAAGLDPAATDTDFGDECMPLTDLGEWVL